MLQTHPHNSNRVILAASVTQCVASINMISIALVHAGMVSVRIVPVNMVSIQAALHKNI